MLFSFEAYKNNNKISHKDNSINTFLNHFIIIENLKYYIFSILFSCNDRRPMKNEGENFRTFYLFRMSEKICLNFNNNLLDA